MSLVKSVEGKVILECERKVAYDSPDHLVPWGTKRDNSTYPWFNDKLYRLYAEKSSVQLRVLDLGCSGGGFVKACIDDGNFAVGLEGSDFSKKHRRAEWRSIPENLFTCDITKRFSLSLQNGGKRRPLKFNVVTTWEVMEHITEKDVVGVAENVKRHLEKDGLWIMSIAPMDDYVDGVNLHQTVKPRAWWIKKLEKAGFKSQDDIRHYFDGHFLRGGKRGNGSFNLVLSLRDGTPPTSPRESLLRKMVSKWRGSKPQKILRLIVTGEADI